jgi:sporulation protein YlmC with PRC-barrel domain
MVHKPDGQERTAHAAAEPKLVKLSDSGFVLEDPNQDLRGLDVYGSDGKEIGTVEDFYVDSEDRRVRFLDVGAGGFLGIGEKHFLIPVEAVASVYEDGVTVDQSREKVTGSPPFDTSVVPQDNYLRDIYHYYGYGRAGGHTDPGAWPRGL